MALLDRYIQAVQRHLPVTQRDDAGRELRELLNEQIATKESNKGSSLTDKELENLLKAHGHPYQVAHAIIGKRGLISPNAFPLYKRALVNGSALFFMIFTLWSLLNIALGNRTIGMPWLVDLLTNTALSLLVGFAGITGIFHYLGDWLAKREFLWSFNPKRLPAIDAPWVEIKLPQCVGQIVINIAVLFFLASSTDSLITGNITDGWQIRDIAYYIQIPMFITVCLHVINVLQPIWTKVKLLISAMLALASGGLLTSIIFVNNPFGLGNDVIHIIPPMMVGVSMLGLAIWQIKRAFSGLKSVNLW